MIINNGLDLKREFEEHSTEDWTFGALSEPSLVSIPEAERDKWLPVGETQFSNRDDFKDCATRSPLNHAEALFSYHYMHGMLPANKQWFVDNGYVGDDGRLAFSDRFVAINSGTTRNGNSLKAPLEAIRKQGLIPKKSLPKTIEMAFDEYHDKTKITQAMRDLGAEFARRFTINYEQVNYQHFGECLKDDMIGVAGYAWPIPVEGLFLRTAGTFNHAFLLYKLPKFQAYDNYYDYDNNGQQIVGDFTKNLAPDYDFYEYGYRVYISKEDPNATEKQLNLLQQLLPLLKKLYAMLLGR